MNKLEEEVTLLAVRLCLYVLDTFQDISGILPFIYFSVCMGRFGFKAAFFVVKRSGSAQKIKRYKAIKEQHQINENIKDREVRLIDENGEQLGIVPIRQALETAEERELDLVKISPNANPPVCKIMNYGKYVFELAKKEKEAKRNQKLVEIKEVWLSMTIDVGDLNVKAKQAQKFLTSGNKVKVSIRMKGRQNAHANLGIEVMNRFFELVKDCGVMEKRPLTEGRSIWMMLAPVKA